MLKEEIQEMAKCIVLPGFFREKDYLCDDYGFYEDFLKTHEHIILTVENPKEACYTDSFNGHHFTTLWSYNNILPRICELLQVDFKISDFYKKNNIHVCDGKEEDFSYLMPYNEGEYTISCDKFTFFPDSQTDFYIDGEYKEHGGYEILIGDIDKKPCFNSVFLGIAKTRVTTPYHCLFIASHQCCEIINHQCNNGRKLLISGDSQMIPLIPILANYFEKIVVLDNRNHISQSYLYENETFTDVLFEFCTVTGNKVVLERNFE